MVRNSKHSLIIWNGVFILFVLSLLHSGQIGAFVSLNEHLSFEGISLHSSHNNSNKNTPQTVEKGAFEGEWDEEENEDNCEEDLLFKSKEVHLGANCSSQHPSLSQQASYALLNEEHGFSTRVALFIRYEDFRL